MKRLNVRATLRKLRTEMRQSQRQRNRIAVTLKERTKVNPERERDCLDGIHRSEVIHTRNRYTTHTIVVVIANAGDLYLCFFLLIFISEYFLFFAILPCINTNHYTIQLNIRATKSQLNRIPTELPLDSIVYNNSHWSYFHKINAKIDSNQIHFNV